MTRGGCIVRHDGRWSDDGVLWLGAADVFAGEFKMPFCGRDRLWKMLVDECASEAGPCGKKEHVDCLGPGVDNGTKRAEVEPGG